VNAVLHVDCGAGFDTVLIPFVAAYVGEVDLTARTIQTQWERGWLEALAPEQEKPKPEKKVKTKPAVNDADVSSAF
jgi:hypothetical protein